MAKKESNFVNMVFTLFVITLVSSSTLGFVYELTKEPIRLVELAKKNNAIKSVVPAFDNNPSNDFIRAVSGNDSLSLYTAMKNGEIVGTAVETFTMKGFSGLIKLMVGFAPDGSIIDIVVLEHTETPGLGDKIEKGKSNFSTLFQGKNPADYKIAVKQDNGEVNAITAATISSRAYCDAVQRAYNVYMSTRK